jgi:hypothetical protein
LIFIIYHDDHSRDYSETIVAQENLKRLRFRGTIIRRVGVYFELDLLALLVSSHSKGQYAGKL